jgi:flagellar hook-length control protein FliK
MSQLILPQHGKIGEIFPRAKSEIKQPQNGNLLPLRQEPSFKKVLAKMNHGDDERNKISSPPASRSDSVPASRMDEIEGKKERESTVSGGKQETISALPDTENTPDLEEEAIVSADTGLAAAVPAENHTARRTERENPLLPDMSHSSGQKEGKGSLLQADTLEENHAMTEKAPSAAKEEKNGANLAGMTMNKDERQSTGLHSKVNAAEEAVVLAGDAKKGAETGNPLLKDNPFKKVGDVQITGISSLDAEAENHSHTGNTKSPFTPNPSMSANPANQGKIPFVLGFDGLQDAETVEKEWMSTGKEFISQGNISGTKGQHVYTGDRIVHRGVAVPLEQIVQETGKLLEKGGKVQLILHPPSLGKMNMEVVVRNNRVELMITVGNADVQQALQASSDQLRNALQNQGFQFDQMSVLLKRENMGFNSEGHPLWQEGQREGERHKGQHESASGGILPEPGNMRYDETGGLSVFA